jgi:hypothetical protein
VTKHPSYALHGNDRDRMIEGSEPVPVPFGENLLALAAPWDGHRPGYQAVDFDRSLTVAMSGASTAFMPTT